MKSVLLVPAICAAAFGLSAMTREPDATATGPVSDARLARDVLAEMNAMRTDPKAYVAVLRDYRAQFQGRLVLRPGRVAVQTFEGVAAVDEAIRFLQRQPPAPALEADATLALAAADLVRDQGASGRTGHLSPEGLDFGTRLSRRGAPPYGGENISYGYDTAREVILQLLVDDGQPGRGHRANLFRPAYARAGVGCGPHAAYDHMCVIDYGYGRGE